MSEFEAEPVAPPMATHTYGLRVELLLGSNVELELPDPGVSLFFRSNLVLGFRKKLTTPKEQANNLQPVLVELEGFGTETEADIAGRSLAIALLWAAVSKRFTFLFNKSAEESPFAIYDRRKQGGLRVSGRGEGRVSWRLKPKQLTRMVLESGLSKSDAGLRGRPARLGCHF